MGSLPEDTGEQRPPARIDLDSRLTDEVRRLKRELTAHLFIRHGAFWDAVSALRQRWGVRATRALPGSLLSFPENEDESLKQWTIDYLELAPESSLSDFYQEYPASVHDDKSRERWSSDIRTLEGEVIPEDRRKRGYWWPKFLTACVLYDPPDLQLLEFHRYGDPKPEPLFPLEPDLPTFSFSPEKEAERADRREIEFRQFLNLDPRSRAFREHWSRIALSLPSVVELADPVEVEDVERWFRDKILHEIMERYIKPQGLDTKKVLDDAMDATGLQDEYLNRKNQVSRSYYIVVDEFTSEEDVASARRAIRATQSRNRGGRPRRDPLIAITCALLHDRYNEADPTDKRVKRWSYQRLYEEFQDYGVRSERSAEEHTNLGRRLLENRLP